MEGIFAVGGCREGILEEEVALSEMKLDEIVVGKETREAKGMPRKIAPSTL